MALLLDVFGYLSIILHGLTIVGQSVAVGSVLFLVGVVRWFRSEADGMAALIERRVLRIGSWAASGLLLAETISLCLQYAVLSGTLQLPLGDLIGAQSSVAAIAKIASTLLLLLCMLLARRPNSWLLLLLSAAELTFATFGTHAAARLDDRVLLFAMEWLHQFAAAIWIGGLPCFVMALARLERPVWLQNVGGRFSQMSMVGVGCILLSGSVMCVYYIGDWRGFYGTAYGIMVGAKISMLLMLLLLGAGNFLVVGRLRAQPETDIIRLRRFAEVEIGIGFSIFFAAASLTSVPPAVDQLNDRVTWHEIVERNTLRPPRLTSPAHDILALPALQDELDRQAHSKRKMPETAFTPGAGVLPPRNAADIAWSEYNHHWAGIFVIAVAFLAMLAQAGVRVARHWPLLFLGLAVFLFLRSDPEVWPLGAEGFFVSLRDVEVFQHRVFVIITVIFALFEWRVRAGNLAGTRAAYVFPIMTAAGGALLLTHSHAISNVHDQVLIELTHTPLALLGIAAGWSRWLELRLPGRISRYAGWTWPVCLALAGLLLLMYREA